LALLPDSIYRGILMEPEYSAVLVRFGEIGIKSNQTRRRMTSILMTQLQSALREKKVPFEKIRQEWGRIFIETSHVEEASTVASKVFGVVSTSPCVVVPSEIDTIISTGFNLAKLEFNSGLTFAVKARRIGEHTYSSQDIREKLGAAIYDNPGDLNLRVDLSNPEQEIYVEVRNETAYIFTRTYEGVGGMPTGTQGKVVCTLSTGLDSPMAAYKVMKRGCIPIFVYFDNLPHSNEDCIELVRKQAQTLADYIHNHKIKLYIIPHGPDLDEALAQGETKLTCIFCKRNMMRLARKVALREKADAIVTGEIIGEQASQTTANLFVIDSAVTDLPIIRPLAGEDKVDVVALAREVGTYDFAVDAPSCCTLAPKYPAIKANLERVRKTEDAMDLTVLEKEIEMAKTVVLRTGNEGAPKSSSRQ
jgi:thiamine biosynthesis protein ThiI